MNNLGIEAFLTVVRTQNISKAASELHLAQSTVSKRIRMLEQEAGCSLIERGKGLKSVYLTPSGELFVELARRWASLNQEMNLIHSRVAKMNLSIGVLDTIVSSIFPSLYEKLTQHQEQYRLNIITGHSTEFYSLIEQRKVDVAFSLIEQVNQSVHAEPCYQEPFVVLRTAMHRKTPVQVYKPSELDTRFELYVRWGATYHLWHDAHWDFSMTRVHLDTAQLIQNLLQDDNFWAIVPLSVAKNALKQGNFCICYLSEQPPERIVYKLTHKYPKASTVEALRIFDSYLQEVLAIFHNTHINK